MKEPLYIFLFHIMPFMVGNVLKIMFNVVMNIDYLKHSL